MSNSNFPDTVPKNTQIFMKTRPVGAELFSAGGLTGHDDVNSRFSQFCVTHPKN